MIMWLLLLVDHLVKNGSTISVTSQNDSPLTSSLFFDLEAAVFLYLAKCLYASVKTPTHGYSCVSVSCIKSRVLVDTYTPSVSLSQSVVLAQPPFSGTHVLCQ